MGSIATSLSLSAQIPMKPDACCRLRQLIGFCLMLLLGVFSFHAFPDIGAGLPKTALRINRPLGYNLSSCLSFPPRKV